MKYLEIMFITVSTEYMLVFLQLPLFFIRIFINFVRNIWNSEIKYNGVYMQIWAASKFLKVSFSLINILKIGNENFDVTISLWRIRCLNLNHLDYSKKCFLFIKVLKWYFNYWPVKLYIKRSLKMFLYYFIFLYYLLSFSKTSSSIRRGPQTNSRTQFKIKSELSFFSQTNNKLEVNNLWL